MIQKEHASSYDNIEPKVDEPRKNDDFSTKINKNSITTPEISNQNCYQQLHRMQ